MKTQNECIAELLIESDRFILIVLDACRYDFFQQWNTIKGELTKVVSSGSATKEWLTKTWPDAYPDIAYVSANPYISARLRIKTGWLSVEHFEYVEEVWKWGFKTVSAPFNGFQVNGKIPLLKIETVPAGEVVKGVMKVIERGYTRIIAHFMQPHSPYIGKTPGQMLPVTNNVDLLRLQYRDNLIYVLREGVIPLLHYKGYKTIVTADHGESLGEGGNLEHRDGLKLPELIEVPWFVPESI